MIKISKTIYPDGSPVTPPISLSARRSYKEVDVVDTLEKLFHSKCAYCESKYTHLMPVDIEHFRPKSKYPWLEFDWNNLLPSCIDCNRKRYQDVQDEENKLAGKKDDFPLYNSTAPLNDAKNEKEHDLEEEEKIRQLLNPCIEDPEDYLKYDDNGYILTKNADIDTIERGQKSIETFGLYRLELVKARKEHLIAIIATINRITEYLETIDKTQKIIDDNPLLQDALAEAIAHVRKTLKSDIDLLKNCKADNSPYSGMARQYINKFLDSLNLEER
jgi:uncharacterized protein (TIGR02646 family)